MKTITEYIQKKQIQDTSIRNPDIHSKDLVYDYSGEPWTLKAYAYLDNHEFEGCIGIKQLLHDYDWSGVASDDFEYIEFTEEEKKKNIYVGVINSDGVKAVFSWGPEGVCYENKNINI